MAAGWICPMLMVAILARGAESKTVYTSIGYLEGMEQEGVNKFFGIPFAEKPIGDRRFAKPVWKTRMSGVYNATYFRNICPQLTANNPIIKPTDIIDEDCLYLNIYSPLDSKRGDDKSVMVWIHGGGYVFGSGQDYFGTMLARTKDVIVVTTNYRLGLLGFLTTGDSNLEGNYGLWDQTMALEWIKVNIAVFGGDPNSITIFGESAGSSSVTQLAISPHVHGLISGFIAESGTASADWTYVKEPEKKAMKLGRLLNCPTESNKALADCIKGRPLSDLMKQQEAMQLDSAFLPRIGTDFLPYTPLELTTVAINSTVAKQFADLNCIIGQNSDEGSMFFQFFISLVLEPGETIDQENGITQRMYDSAVAQVALDLVSRDSALATKILAPIKFMYTSHGVRNDGIVRAKDYLRMMSDRMFTVGTVEFARAHALLRKHWKANSGTYVYLFDHRGSWMPTSPWTTGADHGDEIAFVFGYPYLLQAQFPNVTDEERHLSNITMTYWTHFAKSGNPNPAVALSGQPTWSQFDHDTEKYLRFHLDMSAQSVGQRLFNDRVEFWLNYFPKQLEIYRKEPVPGQCEEL